jgi:flagellar biosynthesis protein FlhB
LAVVKVFNNRFTVFLWEAGALYLLLGAADYLIEKRDFQKQNRMTDEELREDVKQIEGNIESRMRLRHLGYAISMTPRPKPQPPQPAGVSRSLFDFLNPKK